MRELIYFVASLAGTAVFAALSVLIKPESLIWQIVLYGGTTIFVLCAIWLAIDIQRKRSAGKSEQTTGIRVSGKDNQFINVDSTGFDTGIDVTRSGARNQFINVQARAATAVQTEPHLPLLQVIERIISHSAPAGARADAIFDASEILRERALLGVIDVFGGINWRETLPANYDRMPRERIPASFWRNRQIDVLDLGSGPIKSLADQMIA